MYGRIILRHILEFYSIYTGNVGAHTQVDFAVSTSHVFMPCSYNLILEKCDGLINYTEYFDDSSAAINEDKNKVN